MEQGLPPGAGVVVRDALPQDEAAWRLMWHAYCAFYEAEISPEITTVTWRRILDSQSAVNAIMAVDAGGGALGFANYVVHPYTWGIDSVCYLEDLYVNDVRRGAGIGAALIGHLVQRGESGGWDRLYWVTRGGNAPARRLYDRFAPADDFVRYVLPIARD